MTTQPFAFGAPVVHTSPVTCNLSGVLVHSDLSVSHAFSTVNWLLAQDRMPETLNDLAPRMLVSPSFLR